MKKPGLIILSLFVLGMLASAQRLHAQTIIGGIYYPVGYDGYTAYYPDGYYFDEPAYIVYHSPVYQPLLYIGLHIAFGDPYWYYPRIVWRPHRIHHVYYSPWMYHYNVRIHYQSHHYYAYWHDYNRYPPAWHCPPYYRGKGHRHGGYNEPIAYQPRDWQRRGTAADNRRGITRGGNAAAEPRRESSERRISEREYTNRPEVHRRATEYPYRPQRSRAEYAANETAAAAQTAPATRETVSEEHRDRAVKYRQTDNSREKEKRPAETSPAYTYRSDAAKMRSERSQSAAQTTNRSGKQDNSARNERSKTYSGERHERSVAVAGASNRGNPARSSVGGVETGNRSANNHSQASKVVRVPQQRVERSSSAKTIAQKSPAKTGKEQERTQRGKPASASKISRSR